MIYYEIQCYSSPETIVINSEDVIVLKSHVYLVLEVSCISGPYFDCLVLTNQSKILKTSFNVLYLIWI